MLQTFQVSAAAFPPPHFPQVFSKYVAAVSFGLISTWKSLPDCKRLIINDVFFSLKRVQDDRYFIILSSLDDHFMDHLLKMRTTLMNINVYHSYISHRHWIILLENEDVIDEHPFVYDLFERVYSNIIQNA